MIRYRAAWVVPVTGRPLRDAWVAVEGARIAGVGRGAASHHEGGVADLGRVAVLPGVVNAHTHLELSFLRRQVPETAAFVDWIRAVVGARRQHPDPFAAHIVDGIKAGIDEAVRCGTAVVGDISNTLAPFQAIVQSPLAGVVFYELIRFNAPDAAAFVSQACRDIDALPASVRVRASLAAHAPYSVAPEVFRAMTGTLAARDGVPGSVHLSESRDEVEFIRTGEGEWRRFLHDVGAWNPGWTAPGVSPVQYLDQHGVLGPRMLAVHGVQMSATDLAILAARGTTLVTCPRSNQHTGAGVPPIAAFYEAGVPVAVGTDSLASTPDLNVFTELRVMRDLAPQVPAAALIESATLQGARALGFDADYGSLAEGRVARLLSVSVPDDVTDVEEYLVSGITPDALSWVAVSH